MTSQARSCGKLQIFLLSSCWLETEDFTTIDIALTTAIDEHFAKDEDADIEELPTDDDLELEED